MIEPGIYPDMSNGDYHAEPDHLSSSQLKALLPEHYKPGGSSYAIAFGTAFHTRALGAGEEVVLVETTSDRTKAYTEAAAAAEAEGKVAILARDSERIDRMVAALHDHADAADLLFNRAGSCEESAFAVYPDGLHVKARFDRRLTDGVIVDLKSTSAKPGRDSLTRAVLDYGYDVSAAHYLEVADLLGLGVQAFALVFVAKEPPHYVTVAEIDEAFLARGYALRDKAIARHLSNRPPYDGAAGFITLSPPRWATNLEEIA